MIDTHCHLNDPGFDSDIADVLDRAKSAGVDYCLVAAYDLPSCEKTLALEAYPGILTAYGIHPHDAKSASDPDALSQIRRYLEQSTKAAAVGEIGLDYHYDLSPRDEQVNVFRQQIRLAQELNLPITIHSRKAEDEVMDVLLEEGVPTAGAVLHSFTGTVKQAARAVEMGLYIGATGIITFKKSDDVREMLVSVPLNRLLLETDCPYLAPIPHRGKRNEPSMLPLIAARLAEMFEMEVSDLTKQTEINSQIFFTAQV